MYKTLLSLFLCAQALIFFDLRAATFTVTTTADTGAGSLRQAIIDANANSGADLIEFNISPAGEKTIIPSNALGALAAITDPLTIDGTTQPGFSGKAVIEIAGTSVLSAADGLRINSSNCVIRGLVINRFRSDGIEINGGGYNVVEGCILGLDLAGATANGNSANGVFITNSVGNRIGGSTAGARNIISGNDNNGVRIEGAGSVSNNIAGNIIGLDITGAIDRGNSQNGIYINGAGSNTIGGASVDERNIISGNDQAGVLIENAGAERNIVIGNYIGSDVSGSAPMANAGAGVLVQGGHDNRIGGASAGEGNLIAFNTGDGVTIYAGINSGTNNAIRGNIIFRNNDLGIDLSNNGVTANDVGDEDNGANNLQNYPVLTGAMATVNNTSIQGTLNSKTNMTYEIDFYSNLGFESAGNYEGEKYLGSASVTTDASGNAVFDVVVNGVVNGRFITATATDPYGNTSEFSKSMRAESTIPAPTILVTTTSDSGAGSLRQALIDAGNYVSADPAKIYFDIPGDGPHYIAPVTALPVPTEAVAIDGYSQPGASPNTLAKGNDAILKIHLSGSNVLSAALRLTNSGNIVRGLSIIQFNGNGLEINGNSNRVEGCFIGLDSAGAPHANSLSGIRVGPVNVLSNSFGGRNNIIGGSAPAARNVISGNSSFQLQFDGGGTNIVQGNYIGTTPSGDEGAAEFASAGIYISSSHGNLIGGAAASEGNVISGARNGNGITIFDMGISSTRIVGNIIGADPSGTKPAPNKSGIVANASGNVIGGVTAGEANLIAFNTSDGVNIVNSGTNNTTRGNAIFSNGGLAINLGFDPVNPNDEGDADTGPNNVQNYPVITAATITPAETTIATRLNSLPNRDYVIDFYANVAPDQNGYSEAKQYLGSTTTTTAANGNSAFTVTLPTVAAGRFVVATATDPDGNTSEISSDFEAASTSPGETFIVTNTNDSGPGSLRQAILDNNVSLAGANNIIEFNIPGPGPHTIAPTTGFAAITHAATFDGFSQPGAQPNTLALGDDSILGIQIDGNSAIQAGLNIQAPGCVIRGFSITHFGNAIRIDSSGAQITGCWIGLSAAGAGANLFGIYVGSGADTVIGGPNPADRNVISGNVQFGIYSEPETCGSKIQGNYIGVAPSGLAITANAAGLQLSGADHLVGGAAAGAANVISGNGQGVILFYATNCIVQNNLLGPDARGIGKIDTSSGSGLSIANSCISNLITGNTISGNSNWGILVHGEGSINNRVVGNNIGADVNGAPLGNYSGIAVHVSYNEIGGTNEADGNLIAFNAQQGIILMATNCPIRMNRFVSNGSIAIDLSGDGVTGNDATDADTGPNHLQNYPVITSATIGVSDVQVTGYLQSSANESFELDFYANAVADPSGNGEGEQYLGTVTVIAGADGRADFTVTFPKVAVGRFISATATDSQNNTSEFSISFHAGSTRPVQSLVVTTEADSGPGSLRQALIDAGNFHSSGPNKITFNIPGSGLHVINVLSQLPTPAEPVEIDGFTQPGATPNTDPNLDNAVRLIAIRAAQLNGAEDGLRLAGPGHVVRGLIISEFPNNGILLDNADNALIESSQISSNRNAAIAVNDTVGATIGGSQLKRNILFGNFTYGVWVTSTSFRVDRSADIRILGNFVGVDAAGTNTSDRNQAYGIFISIGNHTQIGGIAAGEGNLIAYNGRGVAVQTGLENRIRGNRIYANSSLAIDLGLNGVTQNDNDDADFGPNNLQNFPTLQAVNIVNGGTRVAGNLNSVPNTDFTIDLYDNDTCDTTGNGEGARYITSINIRTDASGNAPFDVTLPFRFARGVVTATATDAAGNTSEFSSCVMVGTEIPAQTYVVTNTSDSGPGSFRQAILDANDAFTMSRNTIAFNIPGNGVQMISPVTPLPDISNSVYVNGFTQPGSQVNTSTNTVNAVLTVRIDGATLGGTNEDGVTITGNDVLVRGLIVTRFTGAGIAAINTTNVVVTECFLGVVDAGITAASPLLKPLKKPSVAAEGGEDPYEIYKINGNRVGLYVKGGRNFSTVPVVAGIVGLLVAGNADQGAVFARAVAAQLLWAYFIYNGGFDDPCGGGIRLRGTTGMLLQYTWVSYNFPNGIELDDGRNTLNSGTIIRNCWLRYNSLPDYGAVIYADKTGLGVVDNSWLCDNFNHAVYLKGSTSGQSAIYGTMIMRSGGAGILVEDSQFFDIGGSSASQRNTLGLNAGGIVSYDSKDIRWLDNRFGLMDTPRIVGSNLPHGLSATRTDDGADTVVTISGHGAPQQTVEIAIFKVVSFGFGPGFDSFTSITATTDANGNFTTIYRTPTAGITSVGVPFEVGVMAGFGFLDCTEMIRAAAPGQTGDLAASLTGLTTIQSGQSVEYVATIQLNGAPGTYDVFKAAIELPEGITIESSTLSNSAATNSSGSIYTAGNSIVVNGNIHAGEALTVKFKTTAAQTGTFDISLTSSVLVGADESPVNNNAQLHVGVIPQTSAPDLSYSLETSVTLKLTFGAGAKLESTIDIGSGQWQRNDQASPVIVDPNKPKEFFRAVIPPPP